MYYLNKKSQTKKKIPKKIKDKKMESETQTQQTFEKLMEDEANKTCFECGCNGVQWASVTNGIFICMQCAGKHRGFGVTYSFVRSLTIDSWYAFDC